MTWKNAAMVADTTVAGTALADALLEIVQQAARRLWAASDERRCAMGGFDEIGR